MSKFSMAIPTSRRPKMADKIFGANKAAVQAAEKYGFENVTNSTIGALMDDEGHLTLMRTVIDHYKSLEDNKIAAYAPINGLEEYLEKVQVATFRDCRPDAKTAAIATMGGTGAIMQVLKNYSFPGEKVLTSDWYWSPYKTICNEHLRELVTYNSFDENKNFDINSFKNKVNEILEYQDQLVILLNAPAHNPTGFSLENSEWKMVVDFIQEVTSADKSKKVILFCDVAYIDFAGETNEVREFMKYFSNLNDNFLVTIGFSMSKGYTFYGFRCGAIIALSQNQDIIDEFVNACGHSARGCWSNGNRGAMQTLVDIFSDDELLARVDKERDDYRALLETRSKAFMDSAKEIGLETCPFKAGFFISIPCDNPDEAAMKLREDNLYVVALAKGLRFAPCCVSKAKCEEAPKLIKKVLDELK